MDENLKGLLDNEKLEKSKGPTLREGFQSYKTARIEFEMIKSHLTDELRKFEQEKVAAELKKNIISEMLKQGDFSTMPSMPEAFFTEETESDTKYAFLAEAAVLAADYFREQGFDVDVRHTFMGKKSGYSNHKKSAAGIYFTWNKKAIAQPEAKK